MRLIDVSAGRDNNFNLIRFLSATAVLFSHSFSLSTGTPNAEPLVSLIGMTPGSIAVDVFFLASGFLVTASIFRSRSLIDYTLARVLRIFPGLLAMLTLTVFGMGLALTTLSWQDYLHSSDVYRYFAKCARLDITYHLPGVFADNPYKAAVNGSLWTLPYEVEMYALLAAGWMLLGVMGRYRARAFTLACVIAAASSGVYLLYSYLQTGDADRILWLFFMFFSGATYFVLRKYIWLSTAVLAPLLILLLVACFVSKTVFFAVYLFGISYITFYLAYAPGGFIRRFNKVSDFSYGIYIYAFPIQQTVVAVAPGIAALSLFMWSGLATFAFAMLSWFIVEKPAQDLKPRLVAELMGRLGYERSGATWQRPSGA